MRSPRAHGWWRSVLSTVALSLSLTSPSVGHADSSVPLSTASPFLEDYAKQLQDQSRPEIERLQLVGLLGLFGGDQVRAPLLAVLTDPSEAIRVASARALGWKGNREAIPALRGLVEAPGEKSSVRVAATEALGRIGDNSARPVLLAAAENTDPAIRGAAFWGLTFGDLTSPTDRIPLMRQMAGDRGLDPFIRCQAIQALAHARDAGSADLLLGLLEREPPYPMPLPPAAPNERETMAIRYRQARDIRAWAAKGLWVIRARRAMPV